MAFELPLEKMETRDLPFLSNRAPRREPEGQRARADDGGDDRGHCRRPDMTPIAQQNEVCSNLETAATDRDRLLSV